KSSQLSRWHRLDNSAKIFPAASTVTTANVFRIACVLHEPVEPRLLQRAVEDTLPQFPAFAVRMRAGLFWYYFESNPAAPKATHEELYPCAPMNRKENDGYLFRVLYHEARISLETYHALTDGTGGLEFFQAIVSGYLALAHDNNNGEQKDTPPPAPPINAAVLEDGYRKIYCKTRGFRPVTQKAYFIRGTNLPFTVVKVVHGMMDTDILLSRARERHVTVTALLSALLVYSIYTERLGSRASHLPVEVSLPVNLRGVFGNHTALNFFECVNIGMTFDRDGCTFGEVLDVVAKRLAAQLKKENLIAQNAYKVGFSRVLALRVVPLFLKNMVLGSAYHRGELTASTTLSNLGRIRMEERDRQYIDRFEMTLSPTDCNHLKCSVCSFEQKLVVTFSSSIEQNDVQRAFFRHLTELGIGVTVEANYLYENKSATRAKKSIT
ncbi:MAG: hypothetical protein ACERKO_04055, partial [Acetanaerobacterium sp.]